MAVGRPRKSQVKANIEGDTGKRGAKPRKLTKYRKCVSAVPKSIEGLKYAVYEWERLFDFVTELKLLHTGTRTSFIIYCRAYHDWMIACIDMDGVNPISESDTGVEKVHPCVTIKLAAEKALRGALADFGLKPVDLETRTTPNDGGVVDPMEAVLN